MLATSHASCLVGIEARPVQVEVQLGQGLPAVDIVGLPERAVRESRVRVRAALSTIPFRLPPRHLVLNLAPGDLRKTGAGLDLAIAVSIMAACGAVRPSRLGDTLLVGELGLAGVVRPVRGVLAQLRAAQARGLRAALVPVDNKAEACLVEGIQVHCIEHVGQAVGWLNEELDLPLVRAEDTGVSQRNGGADFAEVRGQEGARRAIEIAAVANHHLLLIGSPGAGKTMMARCVPSVLPPPSADEALEIATIATAGGLQPPGSLASAARPFRAPHHTASAAALMGGGEPIQPGEVTLAHGGVLFLDELPEFRRDAIETLRTTMEKGRVVISRVHQRVALPASPMLVAAMNPCPCGYDGDAKQACTCSPTRVATYRSRVSGPLLDRFDLHVRVPRVSARAMRQTTPGEPSGAVQGRVLKARQLLDAAPASGLVDLLRLAEKPALGFLESAMERLGMSARAYVKSLRVARTIAALEGHECIDAHHVAEALQYRFLDRRT